MVEMFTDKEILDIVYSNYDEYNDYDLISRFLDLIISKKMSIDDVISIYPHFIHSCQINQRLVLKKFSYKKIYRENYYSKIFKSKDSINIYKLFKIFEWEASNKFTEDFKLFILNYLIENVYKKYPNKEFKDNFLFNCSFNFLNNAYTKGIDIPYLYKVNNLTLYLSYVTLHRLDDEIKPLVFLSNISEMISSNKILYNKLDENLISLTECDFYIDYLFKNIDTYFLRMFSNKNIPRFYSSFYDINYIFKIIYLKYPEKVFLNNKSEKFIEFYNIFVKNFL